MKRRVLLVNSAVYLPGEGGYKRTMYLFNMMRSKGYDVTLLTSDFNHYAKRQRDIDTFRKENPEYHDITFLHMKPYVKNISIKRYLNNYRYSHKEVEWIKKNIDNYDVIYFNMPGAPTIIKISKYVHEKKLNIPIIVDVRDLRPEALKVKIRNKYIYNLLTFRMKREANKAYAFADELVAVSNEYLQRALQVNNKVLKPIVVYIGAILDLFEDGIKEYSEKITKPSNEFWLTYAGTIGSSYDLKTAIDAMSIIIAKAPNVRLKILGQGPQSESLKLYSEKLGVPVDFLGFISYKEMAAYLSKSDITLNAIKKGASQSIINKVADYYAAGIPMLNSCRCEEQLWLNEHFNAGINYLPEDVQSLVDCFFQLYDDENLRKKMGENARKLACEKFDRRNSYQSIIELIDNATVK